MKKFYKSKLVMLEYSTEERKNTKILIFIENCVSSKYDLF